MNASVTIEDTVIAGSGRNNLNAINSNVVATQCTFIDAGGHNAHVVGGNITLKSSYLSDAKLDGLHVASRTVKKNRGNLLSTASQLASILALFK